MTQEDYNWLDSEGTLSDRANQIFRRACGENEPAQVINIAIRVAAARDLFFKHWQNFVMGTEDGRDKTPDNLWWYFDNWLADLRAALFEGTRYPWINPHRSEDIWHEFLQLVPTIYVAVIDTILKDPTKLDYIERDRKTGQEIDRAPRRVIDVLPRSHTDPSIPEATPAEIEFGGIVWLVSGCGGSWPIVAYRQPTDRGEIYKWGPVRY